MKKIGIFLIVIAFTCLSANAAFWNKNKGSATSGNQTAPIQNNQAQTEQTETTYPDDLEEEENITPENEIEDIDIEQMYRDMPVPEFKYIHNMDPQEYQDTLNSTWSPYPLFRLTAPLYFKSIIIQPGYYLLTPREHEGKWYILFKVAGKVQYIIPCYKKEMVPMDFYKNNLPQVKLTKAQLIREKTLKLIGKHVKSSKRKPIPDTFLEAEDYDNNFITVTVYWGDYRYYLVLRTIQL